MRVRSHMSYRSGPKQLITMRKLRSLHKRPLKQTEDGVLHELQLGTICTIT